jgi:scyllo-inositol 2-dehydrogenase (NADP+)
MRVVVAGLGIQGKKRLAIAGSEAVATVDPVNTQAQYRDIKEVPLESFDAALLCVPDQVKFELISYLLENKKHVLVEKPILTDDDSQIKKLMDLARRNETTCYTAYNHRFEPHFVNLRNVIKSGQLGEIYSARLFYGNGTARDVKLSNWRDKGAGVLPDLGSHLLDTLLFWFGDITSREFAPVSFSRFENKSYDHVVFASKGKPQFMLEATLLSWRNTFTADIFAEKGSAHINCLCKWGPSTLTVRQRVLPSGRPTEEVQVIESKDPTWQAEYDHFKALCQTGRSNLDNDLWINQTLKHLTNIKSPIAPSTT